MYIIQRIIGVTTYALVVLLSFFAIQKTVNIKGTKKVLIIVTIVLSILAYYYVPARTSDFYRIGLLMNNWRQYSLKEIISIPGFEITPLSYLYMYLISLTGNSNLLPAISTLLFYSIVFYILTDSSERNELDGKTISVVYLFVMCTGRYLELISNNRNLLSFAIFALGLYNEFYCHKTKIMSFTLYLIASLLHNASVVLLGIRLLIAPFERRKPINRFFVVVALGVIFALTYRYFESFINSTFLHAQNYFDGEVSYYYAWEYVIAGLWFISLIIIKFRYRRCQSEEGRNILKVTTPLEAALIILCMVYSIFHRYITFDVLISIPIIVEFLNNYREERGFRIIQNNMMIISIFLLLLACARGDLSGFKFIP